MSMDRRLPEEFSDLQKYANEWALPTEGGRYDKRESSGMDEIREFYDATVARAEAAVEYLDRFPLESLSRESRNLMYLLFSLITVSFAVEIWKQPRTLASGSARLLSFTDPQPI